MALVLDASTTLSWCFADEATPYSRYVLNLLRASYAEVPSLWLAEIQNVLIMNERRGRVTAQGTTDFLEVLSEMDIRFDSVAPSLGSEEALMIARRHRLTAYDATYLELAKRKGLALATFDKDLLRAAPLEGVEIVRRSEIVR